MVLLPTQRKERATGSIPRYTQKGAQRGLTLWPYPKEALFKAPYFAREDLNHLFGLTERNPVVCMLDGEDGEEDIFEDRNLQVLTHQFKCLYEGVRIRVDLGRRQLGPTQHLSLEIGKGSRKPMSLKTSSYMGKT